MKPVQVKQIIKGKTVQAVQRALNRTLTNVEKPIFDRFEYNDSYIFVVGENGLLEARKTSSLLVTEN